VPPRSGSPGRRSKTAARFDFPGGFCVPRRPEPPQIAHRAMSAGSGGPVSALSPGGAARRAAGGDALSCGRRAASRSASRTDAMRTSPAPTGRTLFPFLPACLHLYAHRSNGSDGTRNAQVSKPAGRGSGREGSIGGAWGGLVGRCRPASFLTRVTAGRAGGRRAGCRYEWSDQRRSRRAGRCSIGKADLMSANGQFSGRRRAGSWPSTGRLSWPMTVPSVVAAEP
jgi:hypothetical protein